MLGVHEKITPFARGDFLTGAKISRDSGATIGAGGSCPPFSNFSIFYVFIPTPFNALPPPPVLEFMATPLVLDSRLEQKRKYTEHVKFEQS